MSNSSQDLPAPDSADGINVYWFEQTEAGLPPDNDWLSSDEALQLDRLRFAKRRTDWRLGRWTAKRAVALCLGIAEQPDLLAGIQIRVAASGAPWVALDAQVAKQSAIHPAACKISLSHSGGRAMCAVALFEVALGCDLEQVAPRSDAFTADYFTTEEQAIVAGSQLTDQPRVSTLIWSAKESALKALCTGLRLDTRSLIAVAGQSAHDWHPLRVRYGGKQVFFGWWQETEGFVRTIVSNHVVPNLPIHLKCELPFAQISAGSVDSTFQ